MRLSTNTFAISTAMLALTLTSLISGADLGQAGSPSQSDSGYSGAPSAVSLTPSTMPP